MILQGGFLDYAVVFGAGVVVSFTPCVYPLLPITVAVLAGANTHGNRWRGFLLSLTYVLGLALSYSLLAAVAVLSGKVFGTLQNDPLVFIVVGNILLLFALVMLDVIPLPLFSPVGATFKRKRSYGSLFMLGAASGFVVGPCTAPILGTILLYIVSKQNLFYGMSLLFVFAFGVGMSLILAGTFSGFLLALPRSGRWMNMIKKAAGMVLIIMAELLFFHAGAIGR